MYAVKVTRTTIGLNSFSICFYVLGSARILHQNISLNNKHFNDRSLGKQLILLPSNLNVSLGSASGIRLGKKRGVGYLNEVYPRPRFSKSLDIEISSLVGNFKKISALPVYASCFHESFQDKWCLDGSIVELKMT